LDGGTGKGTSLSSGVTIGKSGFSRFTGSSSGISSSKSGISSSSTGFAGGASFFGGGFTSGGSSFFVGGLTSGISSSSFGGVETVGIFTPHANKITYNLKQFYIHNKKSLKNDNPGISRIFGLAFT
jgi:hypothetical protein